MRLLWIDLETSGLDPRCERILEVAAFVADLERPFVLSDHWYESVLYCDALTLERMHPRVREMHRKTGLLEAVRGLGAVNVESAEEALLDLIPILDLNDPTTREDMTTLAGSSVHFDLSFLRVHMPKLASQLSHRVYDVSAVKLFARSLGMSKLPRAEVHRAMADVRESINHAQRCAEWLLRHQFRCKCCGVQIDAEHYTIADNDLFCSQGCARAAGAIEAEQLRSEQLKEQQL